MKNYEVVPMKTTDIYDIRYMIIDGETKKVLDDAQGYGYKTQQKAHAAWAYKNRDKSKDKEFVRKFEKMKKCEFMEKVCEEILDMELQIIKHRLKINLNKEVVEEVLKYLKDNDGIEIPYSSSDILWYYKFQDRYEKLKKEIKKNEKRR